MSRDPISFLDIGPTILPSFSRTERRVRFPNVLSEFVYTRTYARWIEEEGRRETWPETVARYFGFIQQERKIPEDIALRCYNAVLNMGVVPSMRALWSAGPAVKRDNTCIFNCSFLPIDSLRSFSEVLFILMQGSGVGFSVEKQFVDCLPSIFPPTGDVVSYTIPDSSEGWADAFYHGLRNWWKGTRVEFDYSLIRPKGSILKTKGGRSSGPGPLINLMKFCERLVMDAAGRKLRPIECHDIVCQVASIVVVGGHRRSSLISFSDVNDDEMRHAKDFRRDFPDIRYQANNSAFYEERPEEGLFRQEWKQLAESGSGERGFSIDNWWRYSEDRPKGVLRSNPCVTGDTRVMVPGLGVVKVTDFLDKQVDLTIDYRFGIGTSHTSERGSFKTGSKDVLKLSTVEGYQLRLTPDHEVMTPGGWRRAGDLRPGNRIHVVNHGGAFGANGSKELGLLAGWIAGDGCIVDDRVPRLYFYDEKRSLVKMMLDAAEHVTGDRPSVSTYEPSDHEHFQCVGLREYLGQVCENRTKVPEFVWQGTAECQRAYISSLFSAYGSVQGVPEKGHSIRLNSIDLDLLRDVQLLLLNFGIASKIYRSRMKEGKRPLPDGYGDFRKYMCKESHELSISKVNLAKFTSDIGFILDRKQRQAEAVVDTWTKVPYGEKFLARVESVEPDRSEDVYDLTEPATHSFVANGLVVHNCHEIGLRFSRSEDPITGYGGGGQVCNLTAAVMRAHDTSESMMEKVRLATWLGVIQSTFTYFPYLREGWKTNSDEDRLLGVDITGQCDNPSLSQDQNLMKRLNQVAVDTAKEASSYFGVNMPVAITCGKPSGNSSQLLNCASGFHPRFAPYYYRHVRINGTDPLFRLIRDCGVQVFKENGQEEMSDEDVSTWVARFPVKSPSGCMTRDDETAIQQCNRYLKIMRSWCSDHGHNQSATIYVRDKREWKEAGEWLWDHFDEVAGLSFLPFDGGNYRLPPYQEITEDEYRKAVADFPEINFQDLSRYEDEDRTEGAREFACTSGSCEI